MGRWSTTIMGGDTPLDIKGQIYDFLGIEMFPEDSDEQAQLPKELLEKKQAEILADDEILSMQDEDMEEVPMILAVLMMEVGAAMTSATKKAALKCAENDEWAKEDKERRQHIKDFIATVKNYDNKTPTEISEEGLFEAIGKHLSAEKPGLVNKAVTKKKSKQKHGKRK